MSSVNKHRRHHVSHRFTQGASAFVPDDQVALWMLRCLSLDGVCLLCVESPGEVPVFDGLQISLNTEQSDRLRARAALGRIRSKLKRLDGVEVDRSQAIFTNVEHLAKLVRLDPVARELLALAVLAAAIGPLGTCLESLSEAAKGSVPHIHAGLAHILGLDVDAVRMALGPKEGLARSGLLTFSMQRVRDNETPFEVSDLAKTVLLADHSDSDSIMQRFVEAAPAPDLTTRDFDHVRADVAMLSGYLQKAMQQRMRGVNVLLYGPPGTGKTQLSRAIAQEVGAKLYQVRVGDDDGEALRRSGRFENFLLCQALLAEQPEALVLFDEVEDAFPNAMAQMLSDERRDKGWMNRLLEENPVPAFWLSNKVDDMDPAFVRRFDIVLELRVPPRQVRRQLLARYLDGLRVSDRWLDRCAADPDITPADMARAAKVVRELAPDSVEANLDLLLGSQMQVRRGPKTPEYRMGPVNYDLECINSDTDVRGLTEALRKQPHGNICLYGPPGTGKTAFAAWLAQALDRPLLHKRASDLLGMFVGETEARVAAMFREATAENAVLLLDEADSFLRDRRGARQSWEVTQVNELLVQMEAFDGLFVCATNLLDDLDQAAFRRFVWKVRFSVLTQPQRERLLSATLRELGGVCEVEELQRWASGMEGATPGDFAAVARKHLLMQKKPTLAELAEAVRGELAFRPGRRALGFAV